MKAEFDLASDAGIFTALDPNECALPGGHTRSDRLEWLRQQAKQGKVFFIDGEDASRYRIRVLVDEEPDEALLENYENTGGSFRLELLSGKLADGRPLEAISSMGNGCSKAPANQTSNVFTTSPSTSVSRKSRPWKR